MPTIEGAPERQTVSDQLFQTPSRAPLQQQPGLVMFARGGRAVGGGDNGEPWKSLSQLFKYGSDLAFKQAEKQNDADYVRGKTLQMQGKTIDELQQNGESAWTMYGYKSMQAATMVQTWYGQELADIEKTHRESDPNFYREHMVEKFQGMLGDDTQANYLLTKVAEQYIPDLAAKQVKAHAAWAHGQSLQAYQDMALSVVSNDGDLQNLATADPSQFGISKEEQQKILANVAVLDLNNGSTRAYTQLYGGAPSVQEGQLGSLAMKYESGGKATTVGRMSTDGRAFGTYQISEKTGTFNEFLKFLAPQDAEAAEMLRNPATREENWQKLVAQGRIQKYEQPFIMATHYRPAHDELNPELMQRVDGSRALQEVLMSTSIQHGGAGASGIFNKVYREGMSDAEFIAAVYNERKTRFPSSTPAERASIQARLDRESREAIGMTRAQGLPAADLMRVNSAYRAQQQKAATELTQTATLESRKLLYQVASGEINEYQAQEKWDAYLKTIKDDPRYQFDGVATDIDFVDLDFKNATIPAKEKATAKANKENKIRLAVIKDDVSVLTAQEQVQAWDMWKNTLAAQVNIKVAQGMPQEQAQEWANNQYLLQVKHWGMAIDKRTANNWTTAILNPFDSKGIVTQEASQALDMLSTLHSMSPVIAEKYIANSDAADILHTAMDLYRINPSAQEAFMEARSLVAEGKTSKNLGGYVRSTEAQEALDSRVTEAIEDTDPGFFTDLFGGTASKSWEVWDEEIADAIKTPEFRRRVRMQAGLIKRNSPNITDEAAAQRAVNTVLGRSTFVLGSMLTQDTPGSLRSDMGLTSYREPMVENDAVLNYLREYGEKMFPQQWNPGSFTDAGYWRGVPKMEVRYNSTDKLFYFRAMVDPDTQEMSARVFPVEAAAVGKWYKQKKEAELIDKRERSEARRNITQMMWTNPLERRVDDMDFTDKYNTKLTPEEEAEYQEWAKKEGRERDVEDYDLRGAWKELNSGTMTEDERGHLGDKYKKPNHPTFSNQSKYNGVDGHVGGEWVETENGLEFVVGKSNMWSKDRLRNYFETREPSVKLIDRR